MPSHHEYMWAWVCTMHGSMLLAQRLDAYLQSEVGISVAEYGLLNVLDHGGGVLNMGELAERLLLSRPGLTRLMDRMVRAGLVERRRSDEDRRVVMSAITAAGSERLAHVRRILAPWVQRNFADYLSRRDLQALQRAMGKVLEGHDRMEPLRETLGLTERGPRSPPDCDASSKKT